MLSSSWPRRVGREVKRARWSAYRSAILALLATSALGLLPDVSRAACSTGDLNGDGIVDTVKVDFKADPGWGLSRYLVTANDARYEGRGELLYGTYEIVDIDENDRFCEITVPEAGPSADYRTHYLWYDGRDLRYMGSVPGPSPVVDGSGSVLGYRRGTVLHTWFYFAEYRITDSRTIEFVKQDLYPMNSSVILREDLDLFIERSDSAPGVVVRRGEKATVLASDDERWCLLEVKSGTRGWFHCCGSFVGGREADQVFTDWRGDVAKGQSVRLKVDLPLYGRSNGELIVFGTATAGERVTVHSAFNEWWLKLRTQDGLTGVVPYCGGLVGGRGSDEIFDGLSFAD